MLLALVRDPHDGSDGSVLVALCACGHERWRHTHRRRGSDCGSCDCSRWRYRLRRISAVDYRARLRAMHRDSQD